MTVALRHYQTIMTDGVREAYRRSHKAVLVCAPCGAGKTVVFSYIAKSAAERGHVCLVLVHRRELIRQASAKLTAAGVQHGIIAPGHTPTRDPVQVASVQTLARRIGDPRYPKFTLIILDEAHHAVAGQWAKVVAAYPDARLAGFTASPERLDGRGLGVAAGGVFSDLVLGPSVADLIAGGYLVPSRVFAPAEGGPDLSGVSVKGGDYDAASLASAMDKPGLVGDAVAHYARLSPGLPAVAFCVSVKHANDVAAAFRAAGWRALAASGETPIAERDAAIAGLATGQVQVLCACDILSEGTDVPAIAVVIMLRPTQSLGLFIQQVGRGQRPAPGKTHLLILDHAGNTLRHGLPEADREWSLEGRKKRAKTTILVKQCPACFAVHAGGVHACPSCGHSYAAAPSEARQLEVREGSLQEIDGSRFETIRKAKLHELLKTAKTEEQLQEIAKAKGYKRGWIQHILAARGQRQSAVA